MSGALGRIGAILLEYCARTTHESGGRGLAGTSGYALVFTALYEATRDERYATAAESALRAAAIARDRPDVGLFTGLSGLRAAAAYATHVWPACERLVGQCDQQLAVDLRGIPDELRVETYDVIGGYAGFLLARGFMTPCEPDEVVDLALAVFNSHRRWQTLNEFFPERGLRNELGLAHGIVGVLASIALSTRPRAGVVAAVLAHAHRVADAAIETGGRVGWPDHLHGSEIYDPSLTWCYGSLGIATGIHAIARWANDEPLRALAVRALDSISPDAGETTLKDAALCHGTIGAALAFAGVSASESGRFNETIASLVDASISRLEAEGWRVSVRFVGMEPFDSYGELDGLAGIALALATLLFPVDASWMRLHAIQPLR